MVTLSARGYVPGGLQEYTHAPPAPVAPCLSNLEGMVGPIGKSARKSSCPSQWLNWISGPDTGQHPVPC